MSELYRLETDNENSLQELNWAIATSGGEFSLILALCNATSVRRRLMQTLQASSEVEIQEIVLDKSVKTIYQTIQNSIREQHPQALVVSGLESVNHLEQVLITANQVREEFRKNFHFPLVLWVTDEVLQKLIRVAPDLQSWSTTVEFAIASADLINFIEQTADEIFTRVLAAGAGRYLDQVALNLQIGSSRRVELEAAANELQNRRLSLSLELEASLEFMLGRATANFMEESRQHYERSLALFEQTDQFLERRAAVLYSLGIWWSTFAVLYLPEQESSRATSTEYIQKCIAVFEQANRRDLVAKFINALGVVLQQLQRWEELEAVANKALVLHQIYEHPLKLARAYSFKAEVALAKSMPDTAKAAAEQALNLLENYQRNIQQPVSEETKADLEWENSYHRGWYLFALGRSQAALNQPELALQTLETAKTDTKAQYDPELYIGILAQLRDNYFKKGEYLTAFNIKQYRRSIEQQYSYRAFIGAGRLQPQQQVNNPALALAENSDTVAQEIAASGRQPDINRLIERMGRHDHKLTIIHGQSGVGKSSILQAGLIPALKQKPIGTRDVLPVLQQVYPDWLRELGDRLQEAIANLTPFALKPYEGEEIPIFTDKKSILEQFVKHDDYNLLTVLIFDQFEEFFFVYKDPASRKPFYEFLRECLDIPFVKVILSLREDYLYYLLECNNRLADFEVINNNILDKDILYYLDNFSPEDARAVIHILTAKTPFVFEPSLVDELVKDLARDLGEVRPIELQVVGVQLQTERITKLEQYQKQGPKEKFVGRFLEEIVQDCGTENEQIAKLVLYLLTDENNLRPLKTRADLELELEVQPEKLDLILEVLIKSGLIFKVPAVPADRYQLVHDYLVPFVRQQQSERLIKELEKEREQRKLSEARLLEVTQRQLKDARRATFTLAGLAVAFGGFAVIASLFGINLYLNGEVRSSEQNSQLEYLVSSIKKGKDLRNLSIGAITEIKLNVLAQMNQALYQINEINHLKGHRETVTSVSFSPDDKLLATVSEDKTVKVWSIDGRNIQTLRGHQGIVTSVSFSPDGKLIATASKDKTVKIWNLNGKVVNTLKGNTGNVTSVSFSPNSKIVAASDGQTVKVWNLRTREVRTLGTHNTNVTSVTFSPNSEILASADDDEDVKLWSINDRKNDIKISSINNYGATSIRFSENGKNIVVTNKDGTIKIYDLQTGLLLKKLSYNSNSGVTSLSHNGSLLAFVDGENSNFVNTFDIKQSSSSFLGIHNEKVTYLSFSHNGKLLASASKDKTVKLWSIESKNFKWSGNNKISIYDANFRPNGEIIGVSNDGNDRQLKLLNLDGKLLKSLGSLGEIQNLSQDGKTLLTVGTNNVIHLWSIDGKEITLKGEIGSDINTAFSPDGKTIISASNNTIKIWRSNDGRWIKSFISNQRKINKIKFSPDGQIIASVGDDNTVSLWKNDGSLIKKLTGHTEYVSNVTFSPDSQIISTDGDDNVVKLWKSNGSLIKTLSGHTDTVSSVIFSDDSRIIATVSIDSSEIKLWQRDGSLLKSIEYPGIQDIHLSPDGNIVASLNADKTVKLWSINGQLLANLNEHKDNINDISFSHDGMTIASASDDKKVYIWSKNGQVIKILRGHTSGVNKVKFSPDGRYIVSVGNDNMVALWSKEGNILKFKTLNQGNPESSRNSNYISISNDSKIITFYSIFYSDSESSYKFIVKIWNNEGKILQSIKKKVDYFSWNQVSVSPNGRQVVFPIPNYTWNLWSVDNGKKQATLGTDSIWNEGISISPDSTSVAFPTEDNTIKLWDRNSEGKFQIHPDKILKEHTGLVNSISFSPDGKIIASGSNDKTVKLWNRDGTLLKTLQHEGVVKSVSFSPHDGKIIASASEDKTVKLWRKDGTLLHSLPHSHKVNKVSFSPDGNILLSMSDDNTIKLWNTNGKEINSFEQSNSSSIAFSSDSKILAILNLANRQIKLYSLDALVFKDRSIAGLNQAQDVSFSPNNETIAINSSEGLYTLSLNLNELLQRSCDWVRDYLKNNPKAESDRHLCDDIYNQKQ